MTDPIWQKDNPAAISEVLMDYMSGDDIQLDKELILYDIQASKAHVNGLASIKILSAEEAEQLEKELSNLQKEFQSGAFQLDEKFEDCHSAIEHYLIGKLGELGKKIHTGRSRNDQILVATRLFMKQSVNQAIQFVSQSISVSLQQAKNTQHICMPGYTHLQRAVPSSVGMWFAGIAEAMLDNLICLQSVSKLIDSNPLGTAAGYGVNLNLNRQLTTDLLGFSRMQINPVYAQNSRGKLELAVLSALSQALLDIRRYCWDLSIFTTQEFDFIKLPDEMTTGSSIMPNKRNPDLVELMRASYAIIQAAKVELESILSLPSGYQRDLQLTKAPLLKGVKKSLQTLMIFPQLIQNIQLNTHKLEQAIDAPMHATDYAIELSAKGVAFRDAYKQAAKHPYKTSHKLTQQSIKQRISPGGCANLMLDRLQQRFEELT